MSEPKTNVVRSGSASAFTKKLLSTRRRKLGAVLLAALLIATIFIGLQKDLLTSFGYRRISINDTLDYMSTRAETDQFDLVEASISDPFYPIIATPVAVWYDLGIPKGGAGLRPMFVVDGVVNDAQMRYIDLMDVHRVITVGQVDSYVQDEVQFDGTPGDVSLEVAKNTYKKAAGAILVSYSQEGYEFADSAAVLSSYLNIPVIVLDGNDAAVKALLNKWDAKYIIAVGHDADAIGKRFVHTGKAERNIFRSNHCNLRFCFNSLNPFFCDFGEILKDQPASFRAACTTQIDNNIRDRGKTIAFE